MYYPRTYTRAEKLAALRQMMKEAALEARAEANRDDKYLLRRKNPYAGGWFDGFEKPQDDHRKALSEAILYTDAATLLDALDDGVE